MSDSTDELDSVESPDSADSPDDAGSPDDIDNTDDTDEADQADEADPNRRSAAAATDVLEYLVKALVDEPDGVQVDAVDRSGGVQLEVRVAPGDMGRVIGRRGRTAQAIRSVTRAAAVKDGVDVNIEFLE